MIGRQIWPLIVSLFHLFTPFTESGTSRRWLTWKLSTPPAAKALKDYDYMMECSKRPRDYFLASGERSVDRYVTSKIIRNIVGGPRHLREGIELTKALGSWEDDTSPIGGTRNSKVNELRREGFLQRLFLAAVGGCLLLGPMWLMVLHESMYGQSLYSLAQSFLLAVLAPLFFVFFFFFFSFCA